MNATFLSARRFVISAGIIIVPLMENIMAFKRPHDPRTLRDIIKPLWKFPVSDVIKDMIAI
jgi:hypothetical protein